MPVKLCAECIRVKDCARWNELYIPEQDDITGKAIKINIPSNGAVIKDKESSNDSDIKKINKEESTNNKNSPQQKTESGNKISLTINEFYMDQVNSSQEEHNKQTNSLSRLSSDPKQQTQSKATAGTSQQNPSDTINFDCLTVTDNNDDDSLIIDFNPEVINPFGRKFSEAIKEIKTNSPFRKFETYTVTFNIVK